MEHYDVIVIGAGHAGVEAANISDKYGLKTALITKNYSDLGKLSCNPSIGGVGKTHIASEVDTLGGLICKIGDKSAIHYRVLNLSIHLIMLNPYGHTQLKELYSYLIFNYTF